VTKWKTQAPYTIISMHAHNRWSNWYSELEYAAAQLGLPVGRRSFANRHDGSLDREWYVPAEALARVGGWTALRDRADANRRAAWEAAGPDAERYGSDAAW